jgi:NAD(P)-dependent dehydrogenase (short-subunit alcohol dehydrogenase family)
VRRAVAGRSPGAVAHEKDDGTMKQFAGKTAVVTGAASGLGRGIAESLVAEGMRVVIADNRLEAAETTAGEIGDQAVAMEIDVTSRASVEALADRVDRELGGVSVLVNNAGVVSYSPVAEPEERGWRWITDVNMFGIVYGVQTFLPGMLERGEEGHIVNVASLAGIVGGGGLKDNRITVGDGKPELGAMYGYMATKHAAVAISEVMAGDLSGSPIGVSVLCPSHHENTNIYENSARFRPDSAGGPMTDAEMAATANNDKKRDEAYGERKRVQRFPDEAGRRVVRAIREGHFYVITHAETRPAIEHRFAQIMAAYDDAAAFDA